MMDMVERVARAISKAIELQDGLAHYAYEDRKEAMDEVARAAIEAMKLTDPAEGVPGGIAFEDAFFGEQTTVFHALRDAWNTTIDAALAYPSPQQQEMK